MKLNKKKITGSTFNEYQRTERMQKIYIYLYIYFALFVGRDIL